jgi:hypothetical protein
LSDIVVAPGLSHDPGTLPQIEYSSQWRIVILRIVTIARRCASYRELARTNRRKRDAGDGNWQATCTIWNRRLTGNERVCRFRGDPDIANRHRRGATKMHSLRIAARLEPPFNTVGA